MNKVSLCPIPMSTRKQLVANEGNPMENPTLFKSVVRAFHYLTNTHPNICNSINNLNQFLLALTITHW